MTKVPLVTVKSVYPQSVRPKRSFRPCRRFTGGLCRFRRGVGVNTDVPETTQIRGVCGSVGFTDFPDFVRGKQSARLSARRNSPFLLVLPQAAKASLFGRQPEPTIIMKGMIKMSEKRRRDNTLTIRLTKAEKERIERNAKRAGRSITDYLVLLSLETPIHVAEDVKPLLIELKRIGNNLNQITAKINAGAFRSYNFEDMIDGQKKIYEQLLTIARKG